MSLSLKSRAGPFNPSVGKISPGLRPFLARQISPPGGCSALLRPYRWTARLCGLFAGDIAGMVPRL